MILVNGLYGSVYPNQGFDGSSTIGRRSNAGSYAGSQVVVANPSSRISNHPASYAGSHVGVNHTGTTNGGAGVVYVYGTTPRGKDEI